MDPTVMNFVRLRLLVGVELETVSVMAVALLPRVMEAKVIDQDVRSRIGWYVTAALIIISLARVGSIDHDQLEAVAQAVLVVPFQ